MDITAIYYTANKIPESMAKKIRRQLSGLDIPIISVSHKPIDEFGKIGICVGDIGACYYNAYKQILIGCLMADTRYVACCEDDCLYTKEHFSVTPDDDTFCYNINKWWVTNSAYFQRKMVGMCMCIANRQLMIDTLSERFKKFSTTAKIHYFGEPGKVEHVLGLRRPRLRKIKTKEPQLVFNHRFSIGGKRTPTKECVISKNLEPWGKAKELWLAYAS